MTRYLTRSQEEEGEEGLTHCRYPNASRLNPLQIGLTIH
jgi:hypothetical protein